MTPTTQFSQGSIASTGQPYDAAIQGNGFFVLQTPAGEQVYSRAGNFSVDSAGNLVSAGGDNVAGWNAVNGVLNTSGAVSNITIPEAGLQAPVATQNFTCEFEPGCGRGGGVHGRDIYLAHFGGRFPRRDSRAHRHLYRNRCRNLDLQRKYSFRGPDRRWRRRPPRALPPGP